MPDYVTMLDNETGERKNIPVIQVWVDAGFAPDAPLLEYLTRRGLSALIRYNSSDAKVLALVGDKWELIVASGGIEEHSASEIMDALSSPPEVLR